MSTLVTLPMTMKPKAFTFQFPTFFSPCAVPPPPALPCSFAGSAPQSLTCLSPSGSGIRLISSPISHTPLPFFLPGFGCLDKTLPSPADLHLCSFPSSISVGLNHAIPRWLALEHPQVPATATPTPDQWDVVGGKKGKTLCKWWTYSTCHKKVETLI